MASNPDIRASDADRDRVAAGLREHTAEGRLTMVELEERLEAVYSARTMGELDELTADLPEADLHHRPIPAYQRATVAPRSHGGQVWTGTRAMWGAWAVVSSLNLVIWAIIAVTAPVVPYPWWLWVAGPWGALLLLRSLFGGPESKR
ncbi:DUF1707 SHOCT-like domain-containing protein [Actinomadura rupiterrae]|uniref:DUF1707 SHOCT-like domain-containing protein n=1 Tax=Actinomadura rupiterrae TaxID=559627 RepID=UPI0020A424DC|nr:DUF1707 domain-containing protein [Actinomadura rupiterrae]MCP2343310.1 hypothetical protein [Actinomadura rupiterrae]